MYYEIDECVVLMEILMYLNVMMIFECDIDMLKFIYLNFKEIKYEYLNIIL